MAFEVTLVPKENIELGVTQKAVFTLSNVTPTIPVPGPVGPQGPPGPQGPQGIPGTGVNSTDDVPEGDVNLYYTEERVEALIAVTPPAPHTHSASDITDFKDSIATILKAGTDITIDNNPGDITINADIPIVTDSSDGLMTSALKLKLDGIASGAEVNVNADWNATSGDAAILNKPATFTPSAHTHSDATTLVSGFMSSTDKTKLDGIALGAEVNVNADWNATSGDAQILNKPTIVSSVGATAPITSSGGTNPTISTSMATNRLIGRTSAGSGVMEEISVGSGLQLSSGTLFATTIPGAGITKATASGTDTYTTTISGVSAYADGDTFLIRFTNGNTTGATLNINGLGAKTLYKNNDGALIGGDITSGGEMLCIYNSTLNGFQCIGTAPNSLFAYVTNAETSTITKGQPVYAYGGTGDRLTVKLAFNTGDSTSAQTVGLVWSSSIGANQKGLIIVQGQIDGLSLFPTSTWSDGDAVYLGASAGTLTKTKPSAPNHLVYLGFVTTASNGAAGRMYVRVQNGYELQELHNVALSSPPNNNDGLFYETATSLWKNKSIPTALGYIPENVANKSDSYTVSSSTTYATTKAVVDGLATKLNTSLKGASNGLAELDGSGKVPTAQLPSYVDDVLEYANIGALPVTGSAGIIYVTLDDNKIYRWSGTAYTVISDTIALGETSATAYRGDRGKIAYDHSQIITGNPHNSTTADIADSLNKRYVTDAQLTVIGNTSGTNTGDQNTFGTIAVSGQSNVVADASNDTLTLVAGTNISITTNATTDTITINSTASGVTDGDKGDITVSGGGTVWTIDPGAVTLADMANLATGTIIGRTDAGTGIPQAITISTGLTGSASALTANLSVGVNNGQSVIGGARASENLTLSSTSHATKGLIAFGSSAYDETNNRLGIMQTTPVSRLQINANQNSVTQSDANGIFLANSTAAINNTQSISPAIVLQGNGWASAGTPNSQDIRFRIDVLPAQGNTVALGSLRIASSTNGAAYTNALTYTSLGVFTCNQIGTDGVGIGSQLQVIGSNVYNASNIPYRLTQGLSDINPRLVTGASGNSAGTKVYCVDSTNGITFCAANGTRQIARAAIDMLPTSNNGGSETGELVFSTKPTGGSITERLRISATGPITFADNVNLIFSATNGTKIGTQTIQKIGFWNKTPIVQPTTLSAAAAFVANSGTAVNDASTFGGYTLRQVVQALQDIGLLA